MADRSDQTVVLQGLLDRIIAGDASARAILLDRACDRLRRLTRRGLRRFPLVKRWEETDDVLQAAMMRMVRSLESVTPATLREFLALCSTQIRRELIDLKRHYYGPQGAGAHHATEPGAVPGQSEPAAGAPAGNADDPANLADWTEFHEMVERLPADLREVFELIWYQDLTQEEAAKVLDLSSKTIRRRWRQARLRLGQALGGSGFHN